MSLKVSLLFVVIICIEIALTRQSLEIDTTFGNDTTTGKTTVERNQKANQERINLSFPGTKWWEKILKSVIALILVKIPTGVDQETQLTDTTILAATRRLTNAADSTITVTTLRRGRRNTD
jgi:hypothetical protein